MSNNLQNVEQTTLPEISPAESKFESKRNKEGDRCLFFKGTEVDELLGHEVKFYETGVLLVLLDYAKDFSKETNPDLQVESKSFVFYNNEDVKNDEIKRPIFEIHNRNRNKQTRQLLPPVKDIEVTVGEHHLFVQEIDVKTNEKVEYFVDILTGEKLYGITEDSQLSFDI